MARVWGVLAQDDPPATTLTDFYTAPASKHAIGSVIITNTTAGAVTIRVSHAIGGAANAMQQYLVYDYSLPVGASTSTARIAVAATDKVRIWASAANVAFNFNGIEEDD